MVSFVVRNVITYNGMHNYTFKYPSTRQITFQAIRDDVLWDGEIVKTAPYKISVRMLPVVSGVGNGWQTMSLAVPFVA